MENKVLEVLVNAGKPLRPGDIAKELGVDSKEAVSYTHLDVYKRQPEQKAQQREDTGAAQETGAARQQVQARGSMAAPEGGHGRQEHVLLFFQTPQDVYKRQS